MLVRDDGSCSESFDCGTRIGSREDGDLARFDDKSAWQGVHIPLVMITHEASNRIVQLMGLQSMSIDGFGVQRFCPLPG